VNAYGIAAEVLNLEAERDKARGEVARLKRELALERDTHRLTKNECYKLAAELAKGGTT